MAGRLANSLCSGIGGTAASCEIDGLHFAYRPLRPDPVIVRTWRPAQLPSGALAAFHGYFDNADEIARSLGCRFENTSHLYGLAVERWGDQADEKIIGEYCAVVADRQSGSLRLARSPFRAAPLAYHNSERYVCAASVPRAIHATGLEIQLDEDHAADSALLNFSDQEASWFRGIRRVPLGSIVEIRRGAPRRLHKFYNLFSKPDIRLPRDEDYVEQAKHLLDEGIRVCLAGSRTPGSTLSSGLDSSQVVARAARFLPDGYKLPTFTFHPESGWDGIVESTMNGNERPMVEAFAAMHPHVEPHFTDNAGYEHDHRWNDFFHVMGGAPTGLCNMYVFHGLFDQARARGCDMLLMAEWGNYTFSDRGDWVYVEQFLKGQWGKMWRGLKRKANDDRSQLRKFIALCLVPLLPDFLWKPMMHLWHRGYQPWLELLTPLTREFREKSGAQQRYDRSGLVTDRYQPLNRRHSQELLYQNEECEASEIYQGFEQIYGVAMRDPTAYRPLIEFCYGLPVEVFNRDGETRWLAKQMAKGIMPEEQRQNRSNGRWDADWHLRISRRQDDYLRELASIERDPELGAMIDVPRLRNALERLPDKTTLQKDILYPVAITLPRALITARFIRYVNGSNRY
ncbi:MAG: asparagine synthase-related protein [Novosphingobium sp.]